MRQYSEAAWKIASLYSHVLASETRDLAAHIDVAISAERERCAQIADAKALQWAKAFGGGMHEQIAESLQEECESIAGTIRAV